MSPTRGAMALACCLTEKYGIGETFLLARNTL